MSTEAAEIVTHILTAVDTGLGLGCEVRVSPSDEGGVIGELDGPGVARLLEAGGELLEAIQVIASQAVRRVDRDVQVVIDAGGFRARHRSALERLALRAAEEAIETGDEIELDAMSPPDRRIVHMALQGVAGVVTRSEGTEPRRRIIVEPAE